MALKYISSSLFQVSAGCVARPCTGAEEEALGPGECPSNCCVASLCNFGSCQSGWVLDYHRAGGGWEDRGTRWAEGGKVKHGKGMGKGVGTGYGHDSVSWMNGASFWRTKQLRHWLDLNQGLSYIDNSKICILLPKICVTHYY